jgi:hypothetical protein
MGRLPICATEAATTAPLTWKKTWADWGIFRGVQVRVARPFNAQALYFPLAVISTASLALQPSLGVPTQVAREEIAAGKGTFGIRRGEWRDVAASAGVWVLPVDAIILVASGERSGGDRAGIRKVDLRRLRVVLRPYVRGGAFRSERIELIGATANGERAEQGGERRERTQRARKPHD